MPRVSVRCFAIFAAHEPTRRWRRGAVPRLKRHHARGGYADQRRRAGLLGGAPALVEGIADPGSEGGTGRGWVVAKTEASAP